MEQFTKEQRKSDLSREMSYRRGYQQGVYGAVKKMQDGADPTEIRLWVEQALHDWRYRVGTSHDRQYPAVGVSGGPLARMPP
jgi:hypothetical protein